MGDTSTKERSRKPPCRYQLPTYADEQSTEAVNGVRVQRSAEHCYLKIRAITENTL